MDDLAPHRALRPTERKLLDQMLAKGINAPITTSGDGCSMASQR